MKRKIIVNTGTLSSGGAERVLSILSSYLADSFEEVYYVMWLDEKSSEIYYPIDSRVKIIGLTKECGNSGVIKKMYWYRRYIKKTQPDIILSFMVMICFVVSLSLLGLKINQIVAERNDPRSFKGNKWMRKCINLLYCSKSIKGILMQTQHNKSYFKSKILLDKTHVIYNPIIIEKNLIGNSLHANKQKVVVSVGRLATQKKHDVLIKAFHLFHEKHDDFQLIIYGEGQRRDYLEKLIDTCNLKGSVFLPGRSDDILHKISNATMFVLTSQYEGMSNALNEAMCLGLPCISTKVSGSTELIKDGENGFLVNIDDVDSIATKMSDIADNPSLAFRIGKEASKLAEQLSAQIIAKDWVDYLILKSN